MTRTQQETARAVFVTGLRNAHAVENQAEELISRQVERLQNYPKLESRMRQHLEETRRQKERLEQILEGLGESRSVLKDTALSLMGNLAALMHAPAEDEIIKNSLANFAFENYEIATYKSLIAVAEAAGQTNGGTSLLQTSLREEQAMAEWLDQNLRDVTMAYLSRENAGVTAGR